MSKPLLTSPWMRYSPDFEFFQDLNFRDRAGHSDNRWKLCRKELREFFDTPKLPRNYAEQFGLHVQLVAYASPGPDRVKVEMDCNSKYMPVLKVDGKLRSICFRPWRAAKLLLKKRKAIYVECFHKEEL